MTTDEFEREFDLLYNNIMSNAAPSIDPYEKSVFLTKAQEEVVLSLYENSFELTERITESLDKLVTTELLDSAIDSLSEPYSQELSSNSKFFKTKNTPMFITYEALKLKDKDACGNEVVITVKPTKQDEYHRIRKNPFRKAREREALRLNVEDKLEIISTYPDYLYQIRYIRKPAPIILYNEPGLTIDGVDVVTQCELDPVLHRTILDRAVQLAALAYKQTS